MTEKLFYNDAYLTRFTAQVLSCTETTRGWDAVLDRTAFYPEGGGQPCDLGSLGGAKVLDVHERGGEIVHTVSAPLSGEVAGEIDWERRFDLMQQHSGEHIVSGIVHSLYGLNNVGFHMGAELVTVDYSGPLDLGQLARVEAEANRAVWANTETEIFVPAPEELAQTAYRSKKALEGPVRLVRFPGVDVCACCGTHVRRTGEIGLIKLLSCVKFHQGVRIEMLCGGKALRHLSDLAAQNKEISGLLSAKPLETAQAVRRVTDELVRARQERGLWQERSFAMLAERYRGAGDVLLWEDGLDPDGLRRLCVAVMETCGGRCAVFSGGAYAIGEQNADLRGFVKQMNAALNGRGGGKPFFCQGRVGAEKEEIERFFEAVGSRQ